MAAVVRSRRHSLSNPLALDGLPSAPFPFEDMRFPHLLRRRASPAPPRKEPTSPVDSVLSPDFRFPQGDADAATEVVVVVPRPANQGVDDRNNHDYDGSNDKRRPQRQKQRSKSVGARPSRHASPSFEDVAGLLKLAKKRGLLGPLAPSYALVAAYCEFRDALQSLRVGCLTRQAWVRTRAGPGLRTLVRAARPAELALLPIVFPAEPLMHSRAAAADLLTPAVARQLARRVSAAATAVARARRHLDRWQARYAALGDWQVKIETRADDARYLPCDVDVDRAALVAELEKEKMRMFGDLVDRILPRHTHGVHARVQDVRGFLARTGLSYPECEPVMSGALPAPVPGEEVKEEPRQQETVGLSLLEACDALIQETGDQLQQEAGDQPQQQEAKQHGDAPPASKNATPRVDNKAVPRPTGSTSRRQKFRWAYLSLRYGSQRRWRRINHQAALKAFASFQRDLRASMVKGHASPVTVQLYRKAEMWIQWHAEQLGRGALSPSSSSSKTSEGDDEDYDEYSEASEEEEDDDEDEKDNKTASGVVPSLVNVALGDGDDDEWAAQVSKSLRRVGSSISASGSSEEETKDEEEKERQSSSSRISSSHGRSPLQTARSNLDGAAASAPAPGGSKRDSGVVVGCATPTPVAEASGSCEELMQRTGTITQRRRQKGKGVERE